MNQILVVDDEVGIRELLSEILRDEGYLVKLAENAGQARSMRSQNRPDLVLLDIWMPDTDGITLLREWASGGLLTMPVVMMSGHGTIDTAVEATRIGAYDFLEKPIGLQKLLSTVGRALRCGEPKIDPALSLGSLGRAPIIAELKQRLEQIANLKTPLLLTADPGCEVELCARFLHRANTPWVAPEHLGVLAEAPLDLLNQARDGILFLHDIGELSRIEQRGLLLLVAKLDKYNVRLICAVSKSLPDQLAEGAFDSRLFTAISGLTISVPNLSQHCEDIPDLANLILARCIETRHSPRRQFSTAALNALRNQDWPGNLAQLESAVKTLALTSLDEEISLADVNRVLTQFDIEQRAAGGVLPLHLPLREARDAFERIYFGHHMAQERGNMSRVADSVGLERTHLYRKLKQLGMRLPKKNDD
ncbi:MAG: sigma-54 dependent transcriptional regulator [Pseudomonadota bacterium]|nr:sigma-54-dependent Fis family transcriptional regulator [Burkholderiales bacterium]MDQ3194871.1 sigma-54 dependent transcriptional regulator [Pseudomonadota bacterium]